MNANKTFKDYINVSSTLLEERLPTFERVLLLDIIKPFSEGTPWEVILPILYFKLSKIAVFNRVMVEAEGGEYTPVNYYGIILAPSGIGKDRAASIISKHITKYFDTEFAKKCEEYQTRRHNEIAKEAEERFVAAKAEKERFIDNNQPRFLLSEQGIGTMEGLLSMRAEYSTAGWGGTSITNSEFGDYIVDPSGDKTAYLALIKEIADSGNNPAKIIKSEKHSQAIEGVPNNLLVHSPLAKILSEKGKGQLMDFLNSGLARRSFFCYAENTGVYSLDYNAKDSRAKREVDYTTRENSKPAIHEHIKNVLEISRNEKLIKVSIDAQDLLEEYYNWSCYRAQSLNVMSTTEGLYAEYRGRSWKARKLAGLIALFNHPENLVVTIEDVHYAIYQTEVYGKHLARFFTQKDKTDGTKIFELFKNGKSFSKMEVRALGLVGKNRFTNWWAEVMQELIDICQADGLVFTQDLVGNKALYKISTQELLEDELISTAPTL